MTAEGARRGLDLLLLLAGLVAAWQALHWYAGEVALTSPAATVARAVELFGQPRFWMHAWETMRAFALALVLSYAIGLGIGLWLGAHRLSGEVAEPMLVALYSLPKVTLYPMILLIFGLGLSAKVAFGAIHGLIPVAIFTMNAARNIRPVHIKAARSMNLSTPQTVLTVLMPATLPEIVSGLRVGFSLTLLGTMIGELFASQRGLGFLILNSIGVNDVATMMAVTLIIAVFAALINAGLLALDRRLHRRL